MSKQDTLAHVFWQDELAYICSVDAAAPGSAFNHAPDVFARYCDMQANGAQRDGEEDIANHMRGVAVAALVLARRRKEDGK